MMVASDSGESLSPKMEPEMAAPATTATGIPMLAPMLTQAIPTVPAVPQEDPVQRDSREQSRKANGSRSFGLTTESP